MKTLLKIGCGLSMAVMTVVYVANAEATAGRQHAAEQAPLKVTLYEGLDCTQPNGEVQAEVLTNDDADWRLQHCAGGVTWKELRRE